MSTLSQNFSHQIENSKLTFHSKNLPWHAFGGAATHEPRHAQSGHKRLAAATNASPAAQAILPVTEPGTTFTALAANPDPAAAGAPVTLTGTVTAANGAPPTGTVQVRLPKPSAGPSPSSTS